jgi:hypothetical protein
MWYIVCRMWFVVKGVREMGKKIKTYGDLESWNAGIELVKDIYKAISTKTEARVW